MAPGYFMKERATPLDVEGDANERAEAVSRAKAIVIATTHYDNPKILAEASEDVTGAHERSRHRRTRGVAASTDTRLVAATCRFSAASPPASTHTWPVGLQPPALNSGAGA